MVAEPAAASLSLAGHIRRAKVGYARAMSKLALRAPMSAAMFVAMLALTACPGSGNDDEGGDTGTDSDSADSSDGCTPAGVYGDCVSGGLSACMSQTTPICLSDQIENPSFGVCGRECDEVCDCWAAPEGSAAPVACVQLVAQDPAKTCVLDCSGGEACPDGMSCLDGLGICVF